MVRSGNYDLQSYTNFRLSKKGFGFQRWEANSESHDPDSKIGIPSWKSCIKLRKTLSEFSKSFSLSGTCFWQAIVCSCRPQLLPCEHVCFNIPNFYLWMCPGLNIGLFFCICVCVYTHLLYISNPSYYQSLARNRDQSARSTLPSIWHFDTILPVYMGILLNTSAGWTCARIYSFLH